MKTIIMLILTLMVTSVQAADFTISFQPAASTGGKKTEVVEITCSQVAGASVLHRQIGSWVESVDNTSFYGFGGTCALNLKPGVFSETPYCTMHNSAAWPGAGGECSGCNVWSRSATKIDIGGNANNQRMTVICIGL